MEIQRNRFRRSLAFVAALMWAGVASAQTVPPGGFIESASSTQVRPRLTVDQLQALLPDRGKFTFPAPYHTEAVRLTNADDCDGGDCVTYVGYSYWRNTNNHVGSDTMLIVLNLFTARGGSGPTLFSYNKVTDEVANLGPLFDPDSELRLYSGEGWYFSATLPTALYLNLGPAMLRYDVLDRQLETVFDISSQFGSDKEISQMHSSEDDRVHSATIRRSSDMDRLGCVVYREDAKQFLYYPKRGVYDECQIDASGRWLVIKENVDGVFGEDNRIIDLHTGIETVLYDQQGAGGHSDLGHGYMVAEDNWANVPGAVRVWDLGRSPAAPGQGALAYYLQSWSVGAGHISHTNAKPGIPSNQQFVCSSNASPFNEARANEIVCYRLDGSYQTLVVAPVMTDFGAMGGGDDYAKMPKGNLDVTGRYFIWTSNAASDRLDAFLVKVPAQRLVGPDTRPPAVSISSPAHGATVAGLVRVKASASDDVGVVGVQFLLDGMPLGAEDTAAPHELTWDVTTVAKGPHVLTAIARDEAGNTATSAPVDVTVVDSLPYLIIDTPAAGSVVGPTFTISGWAADFGATSGTGIDLVYVYAYPTHGGPPTALGAATLGVARPDVAAYFGRDALATSGYSMTVSGLAPGEYDLVVYGLSTITGTFNTVQIVRTTVTSPISNPLMVIDVPVANQEVSLNVVVAGWALDLAATSGAGVDLVYMRAYPGDPTAGSGPVDLGYATVVARPDVAAYFGNSQFTNCGYALEVSLPAPGAWDIVVWAHSSVAGSWNNVTVVRVNATQ